jgi:hypothetical protein
VNRIGRDVKKNLQSILKAREGRKEELGQNDSVVLAGCLQAGWRLGVITRKWVGLGVETDTSPLAIKYEREEEGWVSSNEGEDGLCVVMTTTRAGLGVVTRKWAGLGVLTRKWAGLGIVTRKWAELGVVTRK